MSLCIIQDTREQAPYTFACITPPPLVEVATLTSGDYSIKGLEDHIAIERKSLIDLFGTVGRGRDRFERELERLAKMRFAAVVIEADLHIIATRPPARSKLHPKVVVRSIAAWSRRYGVHFHDRRNRALAEKWTYILLEGFWKDIQTGKIKI